MVAMINDAMKARLKAHEAWAQSLGAVGVRLSGEDFDLQGLDMPAVDLTEVEIPGSDLSEARLAGAELSRANLASTCFINAILSGAFMSKCNLDYADLTGARLDNAKLRRASMVETVLVGAVLDGADLRGVDLNGTDLRGGSLNGVQFDERTQLDEAWLTGISLHGTNGLDLITPSRINISPTETPEWLEAEAAAHWLAETARSSS